MVVWGGLINSCEKREVKSKGEKEWYIHLNAEFQRISRRDEKAFLSDQRKEIKENNRMGKSGDLFNKIRDTKGTFHVKMGSIKDRKKEKQESSIKTSISALLTLSKPLTMWITKNCGKFWKRWEYQIIWPASWETCMQIRKQQLELDMEQQTCSK